jgi:uroporphyrinogen-III decarboxylase
MLAPLSVEPLPPKDAAVRFHREEFLDLITLGSCRRPMFSELFGLLVGLDREWRAQGATPEELDLTAFDWDYVPYVECGGNTGLFGAGPVTLYEDADRLVQRDALGRTLQLFKAAATVPLPLDFPVRGMDDWLRLKPSFEFHEERIDWLAVERARQAQQQGVLVVGRIPGGWDMARELMGEETACLAYFDQPELMHDILQTLGTTAARVFERITERLVIDQLHVHEDLAGKSGPLVGPSQVRQFIGPYYRRVWDLLSSRGTRLFNLDSDGNLTAVIEPFLESGVNAMHPMEPAAGMDIVQVRQQYGRRLAVLGGIDKYVLCRSRDEIRRELEYKLQPLMRQGGTVFGLDHRIPNGTPRENYRYYVTVGREILGLPPLDGTRRGWGRMAF